MQKSNIVIFVLALAISLSARADFCPPNQHWDDGMQMCMPDDSGKLNLILHGNQFIFGDYQSGPRGAFKTSAPNMAMVDLSYKFKEHNTLVLNIMADTDYWLVPKEGTPELFQIGDFHNNGQPFVDAQHPHSSPLMGLTLSDILDLNTNGTKRLIFFFAPRGEATAGPENFMHRPSAVGNPFVPLDHHLSDWTHVSSTVVGGNLIINNTSLEASAYSGVEPAPDRVDLDVHPIDSFAFRANQEITKNVSVGVSYTNVFQQPPNGIIVQGEPSERNQYVSAWVTTQDQIKGGSLNTSSIYGQELRPAQFSLTSFLEELDYQRNKNRFYGRVECLQRTSQELLIPSETPNDPQWICAYTGGYERTIIRHENYNMYAGGAFTKDSIPSSFAPTYGSKNPNGGAFGIRIDFNGSRSWFKKSSKNLDSQ